MITPVWALTIDKLCERKNDLLFSDADIKELARNERAKAIDEFAERLDDLILHGVFDSRNHLHECIHEIAEQMKGGEV